METKLTFKERVQALKPGQVIWPLVIILVILGIGLGIYNYNQELVANKVPTVTIHKPADNTTITEPTTSFSGTVDKGDKVTVNNISVPVDSNGNFSANLNLVAGKNKVTVVVTGTNGKSYIVTRQITRVVPTPIVSSPQVAGASQANPASLSASGPETTYVISAALISAALVGWAMTKQNLAKALARR